MKRRTAPPVGGVLVVLLALSALTAARPALAAEGMWPLTNLPTAPLQQRFGFTPSRQWIEHVQLASVRLAGGCSGSFVSADGLVLTNHHCVVDCLEGLSGPGHDLMATWFYAPTRKQEPKCPAMEVEQLVDQTNVTVEVNRATQGKTGAAFTAAERAVSSKLENRCGGAHSDEWRCEVVTLYYGGQYWLYKYRRYQDVRVVFAPTQQTAFFGGNPDNFNYPRYDYDMSMVRVYANGKPARTPTYFPVSPQGPRAGELVFTSGNPGSTERSFTVAQLEALRYPLYPQVLQSLLHYQGLLAAFAAASPHNAAISSGDRFFVDNSIKAISGFVQALNDQSQFSRKVEQEKELRAKIDADPSMRASTRGAWEAIAAAQQRSVETLLPFLMLVRQDGFRGDLFKIALNLVVGAHERALPDAKRFDDYRDAGLPLLEQRLFSPAPIYPDYDSLRLADSMATMRDLMGSDAPIARTLFATKSPRQVAEEAVSGTRLADIQVRKALWSGGEQAIAASQDPMIVLAREVLPYYLDARNVYETEVKAPIEANTAKIARARFAIYGTSVYPDATFTERLSYGVVEGWTKDGHEVAPFTTVAGLYQQARAYEPLNLEAPWRAARSRLDPATPMDFVSSNDIVGGNSGSPVIDRDGRLVGLIFDGNLPSLGGSFWYDESLNRAVAVDSAVLLAALKDVYHAQALVTELTAGH
jgi:Peptidase S46